MTFSLSGLASGLARVGVAKARPYFELAFSQMENTMAERVNHKIDQVIEAQGSENRVIAQLDSKTKKLSAELPFLNQYKFDVGANALKLNGIATKLEALLANFSLDGNANDFTANEIDQFNLARTDVLQEIERLYVVNYPGVADTKVIYNLQKAAKTLAAFDPTVGAVDPSGTANPNVNRQLVDYISTIHFQTTVAQTVSSETEYVALDMVLDSQKKLAEIAAKRTQITAIDAKKKLQEIDDLKASYANLLKAISLSYEASFSQLEYLSNSLDFNRPPPAGSVLNILS